ncbi:conserved unknown protein [Ectocarpus siliculosus]|uniref:Uncharacterized protein n=1 Tax=Ectocarpus siliculosus TaxID=2880 RepID=D7FIN4_ECTSI|nr:conserved unknown protein [Ectocarpus siliculosus]|eukprot:CBJ28852.1 conserved unknown protein [Ectocarpus siliculosus]
MPGRAKKVTLNKATFVEIRHKGCKPKRQTTRVLINYDKKDLQQLVSCVERALQKSPSDPPVRVTSLSYAPVETTGGEGGGVLDGTPFCPQPKRQKSSTDARHKNVLLTQKTFNPEVFWSMEKVFLAAVVVREGDDEDDEEEVVNDENNRRLSNGSVATSNTSPAGRGVGTIGNSSDSPSPPAPKPPAQQGSLSPSSPPQLDRVSRIGDAGKRGGGGEGSGGDSPAPPWTPPGPVLSVAGAGSLTPAMSTLSSRGSTETERDGERGAGGDSDNGSILDSSSSCCGGGSVGRGRKQSSATATSSCASTVPEGGGVGGGGGSSEATDSPLASPGPGKRSVLFRRASRLPPDTDRNSGSSEGGGGDVSSNGDDRTAGAAAEEAATGRGSVVGGGTDSESADLVRGGGGVRPASRGDPVAAHEQRSKQPRGSDRDKESSRSAAGQREVGSGRPGTGSSSSRSAAAAVKGDERRRAAVDRPAGDKGLQKKRPVTKTRELYPKPGTTTTTAASARSAAHKSRSKPVTTATGCSTTTTTPHKQKTTTAATPAKQKPAATPRKPLTTTPRKPQQQPVQHQSPWGAKPSERRQPPFKAAGAPKARLPLRTNTATATSAAAAGATATPGKSRPKGTATAAAGGSGGGSGAASGEGSPSPSKRGPPRVSASGHMAWERNLRTVSKFQPKKKVTSLPSKKEALHRAMRRGGKGGGGGSGGGWGGRSGGAGGGGGGGGGGDGDGGKGEDGRPSIGTWATTQNYLKILKEISGKDEEELEWLVVAKKGQGVKKSETRRENAETEYHRLLCEESMQEAGLKLLKDRRLEVALRNVGKLGEELDRLTELLEELGGQMMERAAAAAEAAAQAAEKEAVATAAAEAAAAAAAAARASREAERARLERARGDAEEKLGRVLGDIGAGKEKLRALGGTVKEECRRVPGGGGSALETVEGITADVCSARELIAPARAKSGLSGIQDAAKTLAEDLRKTRSGSQAALARMEKWRERKEALPEYGQGNEVADQEKAWFEREREANDLALQRTRKLIPVGVTRLTVAELEQHALDAGSLYPRELTLRIKENRLLHWVVTHPDDIARSNFLRGDHAHFFTNLDKYDLVELRAIMACLPAKFEVDADGRKAAWRELFLQRAQSLVAQERGDTVSGGWDPEIGARREVQLPQLTPEQTRRKEYFYPTAAEVEDRVQKLQERQRRLEEKQAKLAHVKDELLPEAKEEYANVLEDTRHPANKEAFRPEDLRRARDEAKSEVDRLAKEARRLEGDVSSAKRALRESPYTVDSLRAEADATRRLLSERARKQRLLAKRKEKAAAEAAATEAEAAATEAEAAATAGSEPGDEVAIALAAVVTAVVEKAEDEEVEEGLEVEGAFDPTPELRSRFADKSSSLRFVTADEEARMRKEELASVFAVRDKEAAATVAAAAATEELPAVRGASESSNAAGGGDGDQGRVVARGEGAVDGAAVAAGGGGGGGGDGSPAAGSSGMGPGRMKAFGAVLEKTLSQNLFGRAPPPGTTAAAAAAAAGTGAGGKTMPKKATADAAAAALTPPCKPKSKFFRSIASPTKPPNDTGPTSLPPPPPPPPAPMMGGLLSQIRARGGGGAGDAMGGLLAQIRAAGRGDADGSPAGFLRAEKSYRQVGGHGGRDDVGVAVLAELPWAGVVCGASALAVSCGEVRLDRRLPRDLVLLLSPGSSGWQIDGTMACRTGSCGFSGIFSVSVARVSISVLIRHS